MPNKSGRSVKMPKDKLLPRLTMFVFSKPKTMVVAWALVVAFGIASYTTLLTREGFPSVNIPLAIVNGTYAVNDSAKVDAQIAKPISDIALKEKNVKLVQASSGANFFSIMVQFDQSVNAQRAADQIKHAVEQKVKLPKSATVRFDVPYFGITGGSTKKIDATVSFYDPKGTATTEQLVSKAQAAAAYLNAHKPALVKTFFVEDPFQTAVNPYTGKSAVIQKTFDRYGVRQDNATKYYNSVIVGVTAVDGADVIKLDKQVKSTLGQLESQPQFRDYQATISASYAPAIQDEINELQRVLLEGLVAVLIVGSIVIAIRASLITVLSMVSVITITLGVLYAIGYSLNVITLFALILGLSLIVDDTIIMIEAIDASRRHSKTAREAVQMAVRKISRAMVAATTTSVLSFAPLLFAGGVLGSFIRAIPVTIIIALLISLFVALVFIPQFARVLILGKKQMGEQGVREVAAGFEAAIARFICKPMLWARASRKKLMSVGVVAVVFGLLSIGAGGYFFSKVIFNLFPPTKDTNALSVTLSFPPGTTIQQAEAIADRANKIAADVVGDEFVHASYFGQGSSGQAMSQIDITPYVSRDVTSLELVDRLQQRYDQTFKEASVKVGQVDVGPPTAAFNVQVQSEDREKGYKLANDIAAYLRKTELKRASGKPAHFTQVEVGSKESFERTDGKLSIRVSASFDGNDTTTLVTLAKKAVTDQFDAKRVASYGLPGNALVFDIGQESDNQESFRTLVIAFPILLGVMYFLLAFQFRSLLQPLLIFMAVPFSLLGITLGLYLTNNAFSFFVAMGFFALIGLSIKNTILLTDYANQARASGMGVIDSAVAALGERFRPLVATSLTAIVSLIPLAITSPFWQGLAVTLIFGLLSSTLLVITVFPYYYLGAEFLRLHINRRTGVAWVVLSIVLLVASVTLKVGMLGLLAPLVAAVVIKFAKKPLKLSSN